jgi:hypothetical protein
MRLIKMVVGNNLVLLLVKINGNVIIPQLNILNIGKIPKLINVIMGFIGR